MILEMDVLLTYELHLLTGCLEEMFSHSMITLMTMLLVLYQIGCEADIRIISWVQVNCILVIQWDFKNLMNIHLWRLAILLWDQLVTNQTCHFHRVYSVKVLQLCLLIYTLLGQLHCFRAPSTWGMMTEGLHQRFTN